MASVQQDAVTLQSDDESGETESRWHDKTPPSGCVPGAVDRDEVGSSATGGGTHAIPQAVREAMFRERLRSLMPRHRRTTATSFSKQGEICYTDVVVIGNGPSGICLSYLLSGHWPYYQGGYHPDEMLNMRLQNSGLDKSIVQMDLEYLSDSLEGRSTNPVALLFDALTHPEADTGRDIKSVLHWDYHKEQAVKHVVLGKHAEGGTWQTMEGQMQTLSLGSWMQLPHLPIKDWLQGYRSKKQEPVLSTVQNRASMEEICAYYMDYVEQQGLKEYFSNNSTVTSVERVLDVCHTVDNESGEQNPCNRDHSDKVKWEVRGYQMITDEFGEETPMDFCYRAPNVVLATGAFDTPNKLGVPGENLSYVLHSVVEFEAVIKDGQLTPESDPVMIVGSGLSAADAILLTKSFSIPVTHVFRRDVNDAKIVLSQLPAALYPEYHFVLQMMKESEEHHHGYESHPAHHITQCLEDGNVLVRGKHTGQDSVVKVSYVVVLVGSRPDLSFLPQEGKNLGIKPGMNIDAKNNPIDVDLWTYQSVYECGLFAMGPLVGDNFVRFLRGGALGITSHLWRKREGLL